MISFLAVCLSLWATCVQAQTLPSRFAVSDVAADDVLNIRRGPGSSFEVIGALKAFAQPIEVLETQNGWAMIPAGERIGWVSERYLTPLPTPAETAPRPLTCSGTEPFWTLALYPRGAEYASLSANTRNELTVTRESVAQNGYFIEAQDTARQTHHLIVKAGQCSDGMSDRIFSMSALLFLEAADRNDVQSGCCTFHID